MHFAVRVSVAALALALAACRAGVPGSLPPAGSGPAALRARVAARAASAIAFVSIGPNRMYDSLPTSGKVNAYAVDPSNPKTMYVASGRGTGLETYSSAGIFRSTDGGAHWQAIDAGLTDPSGSISSAVNALWLDPAHPANLLAATEYDGLFRSTDGGTSWRSVYRATGATQFAAYGGAVYATSAAGILVSSDDGATWRISWAAGARRAPTAFATASGAHGNAFYAGMTDGTIFSFTGGAWRYVGRLPYDSPTGTDGSTPAVHQLAADPLQPSLLYASSNDGSWDQDLHASTDGGKTWNFVLRNRYNNLGLGTQAIGFSAVHPHRLFLGTDGGFYYFTADGSASPAVTTAANLSVIDVRDVWTVANGGDDACWVASDQGLDYEPVCSRYAKVRDDDVVTKTVGTGLARRFVVSPNGRTVLVSLQDFESHVTTDGGKTWTVENPLYEDGYNELDQANPNVCYAYDEANGLSVSTDGCLHYRFTGYYAGIYPSRLMTTPLAFDPKNPQRLYAMAGAIVGFSSAKFGAYVTTNQGKSFAKLAWPFAAPGMIVVDAANGNHILVGNLANGRSSISVTTDGGATWVASRGVPATAFWYSATISPKNSNLVLASSVDAADNVFVLRSTDGGRTFVKTATIVNAPAIRARADIERAGGAHTGPAAYVYSPAREIRFNQDAAGTPYAAVTTLRGAFLSTDLGTTWHRLDAALISHSFWGIRWRAGYLYLGSDGQGVMVSTAPLQ